MRIKQKNLTFLCVKSWKSKCEKGKKSRNAEIKTAPMAKNGGTMGKINGKNNGNDGKQREMMEKTTWNHKKKGF